MKLNKLTFPLLFSITVLAQGISVAQQQNQGTDSITGERAVPEIYLAAKSGKLNKVRSLIADGTDVDAMNANGRTALMSAVYFQNKSIVRELLGEGADVNARDSSGRTALMIAVSTENMVLIDLLLAAGADVTIQDNRENTAITMAEKSSLGKKQKKRLLKVLETAAE